ncbi:hypothetical protein [Mycobacteroides abscessus]|uniref:hypothetical protein n=1 Tax=Mycobacteroides abscessus TaxID=36809 RepID=UPI0012FFDD99|nr:hypothetical protein [Mycobacteroides abscessus]
MSKSRVLRVGLETVGACALRKHKSPSAVRAAITDGRLPAITATAPNRRAYYLVRPTDADALWNRLDSLKAGDIEGLLQTGT